MISPAERRAIIRKLKIRPVVNFSRNCARVRLSTPIWASRILTAQLGLLDEAYKRDLVDSSLFRNQIFENMLKKLGNGFMHEGIKNGRKRS